MADVQDGYKYLGIPQANGNHKEAARKSTTARLHAKQKEGGRELGSIRATIQDSTTTSEDYIRKIASSDDLTR